MTGMKNVTKRSKTGAYGPLVGLLMAAMLFLSPQILLAVDRPHREHVVGGPCDYREYKGQAKIVSVKKRIIKTQTDPSQKDRYEVRFLFHTDQVIQEPYVGVEGKGYLLLKKDASYPGASFLCEYGIEVGKVFPCSMKVITKGTCTPIIFEFPTMD